MSLKWSLSPQTTANFGLVLVVLLFDSIIIHRNTMTLHTAQVVINQTNQALIQTQSLHSSISEAEAGARGFAMTGDDAYLTSYRRLTVAIPEQLRFLRKSVSGNPLQIERIDELADRIDQRISQLRTVFVASTALGFDAARERLLEGGGIADWNRDRQIITDLQEEENRRLDRWSHEQDNSFFIVLAANLAAFVIGTIITIVAWCLVEREFRKRRLAEAAAHSEQQNLWVTLTSIGDGVIVVDADGDVKLANPIAQNLMGNPCEVVGRRFSSMFSLINEGTREYVSNAVSQVLEQKTVSEHTVHAVLLRADGTEIPIEQNAAPILDSSGKITGAVFVFRDCSARRRFEAEMSGSEARFRILSESMPQKVWTAKPDGHLDYMNHKLLEYTGLPPERLRGWGWTNLVHPDDFRKHLQAWKESLVSGEMFEIEIRVRKHTGEYRWHLARALPLYQADRQITMWIGTNTDIHDRKLAEDQFREQHHRKDQFLALLAHELRNPLAPLSNAIQVFPSVLGDPATTAALLGIMDRQVRQMTRLIDDLLDLARVTTGRMQLHRARISVDSVVTAAVEAVQPWVSQQQHQLTVTLPQEELWLDADAARLSQVLTNLLHNAAKYTNPRGELHLIAERAEEDLLFRVRDNGPGISREMLDKIFDLFMQVDLTLDRSHGGLGIGLTLVRTLVELHGGTVAVSSDGLGLGSEFTVRLPLMGDDQLPASVTGSAESVELDSIPLPAFRILVVDDVQASAKTLALMLKTLGQTTEVAFDGPSAITRIIETDFNLVFLDIAMPGMDGLEVARKLRLMPDLSSLTLVALTGFGQDDDRERSLQAGFNAHLTKPTSLDLLKQILRRANRGSYLPPPIINGVV